MHRIGSYELTKFGLVKLGLRVTVARPQLIPSVVDRVELPLEERIVKAPAALVRWVESNRSQCPNGRDCRVGAKLQALRESGDHEIENVHSLR